MKMYIIGAAAAIVIAVVIISNTRSTYELEVDALKDQANVAGVFYRVVLTNKGSSDLTNVVVDFGGYNETISRLPAGQQWIVSPRQDVNSDQVIVTTAEGMRVIKEFRTAPKMPGMIGGMG